MREWKQCTRATRCPICDGSHRCAVAYSGEVAKCVNILDGDTVIKAGDDDVGPFAIHRLGPATAAPRPVYTRPGPDRASVEDRARVYCDLLTRLELTGGHREALRLRGLSEDAIDAFGPRSFPARANARTAIAAAMRKAFGSELLLKIPGFARGSVGIDLLGPAGLALPIRTLAGDIEAIKIRVDREATAGAKYLWLSSCSKDGPGSGCPPHFPLASVAHDGPLWIVTEGPLKAEVCAALQPLPVVGIAGISAPLEAIAQLRTRASTLRVAYDADIWSNPHVARGLERVAHVIVREGLAFEVATWDAAAGKGLDDVLAAGRGADVVVHAGPDAWRVVVEALRATEQEPLESTLKAAGLEPEPDPDPEPASETKVPEEDPNDPLANLVERARADTTVAFRVEVLRAANALCKRDRGAFEVLRKALKAVGVGNMAWDEALSAQAARDLNEARAKRDRERAEKGEEDPHYRAAGDYGMEPGRITVATLRDDESTTAAHFSALIKRHVVEMDGETETSVYEVEACAHTGKRVTVQIPAEEFGKPRWERALGPDFAVAPRKSEHAAAAIKFLSAPIPREDLFAFTGWKRYDGAWIYLHAGGAIGADGPVEGLRVRLDDVASRFELEPPDDPRDAVEDLRTAFDLMRQGPDDIVLPVCAAAWRAVLGMSPVSLFLAGRGTSGKSFVASLAQMHFGRRMHRSSLPLSLKGGTTPGAIGRARAIVGDAVFVLDDFMLTGDQRADAQMVEMLEAAARSQYGGTGRKRLHRATLRLVAEAPPRCLTIITGEQVPHGFSLNTRLLTIPVTRDRLGVLDPWEKLGRKGVFARAMGAHVQWLARDLDGARKLAEEHAQELRAKMRRKTGDERTLEMACELVAGLRAFLRHAHDVGVIETDEGADLLRRMHAVVERMRDGQEQAAHDQDEAVLFIDAIRSGLRDGTCHIRSQRTKSVPGAWKEQLGWAVQHAPSSTSSYEGPVWYSQGSTVGYLSEDKTQILLEPGSAYRVARRICKAQGVPLVASLESLRQRLHETGQLAGTDATRGTTTVRRRVRGDVMALLAFHASTFVSDDDAPRDGASSSPRATQDTQEVQ